MSSKSKRELNAELLHKKYTQEFINYYGRVPLTGHNLLSMGRYLFKKKFKGVFAQNEKFKFTPGYYIINTDKKNGKGIHWVGLVLTKTTAFIYDSFGRKNINEILKHLVKRLNLAKIKIKYDSNDSEQKKHEIICGHKTLAWIRVVKDLGIRSAMLI